MSETGIGIVAYTSAFLTSSFSVLPEFDPMSANFANSVQVNHTTGFNPLYWFDIPYPSTECVNVYPPVWVISGPYSQLIGETNQLGGVGSARIVNVFIYNTTRSGQFSINETNGLVIVEQSLGYESFTSVNLTLLAIDQGPHMHFFTKQTASVLYYVSFWTRMTTLQVLNNLNTM